jgi:hypothetical protein
MDREHHPARWFNLAQKTGVMGMLAVKEKGSDYFGVRKVAGPPCEALYTNGNRVFVVMRGCSRTVCAMSGENW